MADTLVQSSILLYLQFCFGFLREIGRRIWETLDEEPAMSLVHTVWKELQGTGVEGGLG